MGLLTRAKLANSSQQSGFTLVEAMLAIAVLMVMSVGSVAANRLATTSVSINQLRSKANILATEGMEAVMNARAEDFLALAVGTYHPVFDGTKWTLLSGEETIGDFTRTITLTPVYRELVCFDPVCEIIGEGGVSDEGSFNADVSVRWLQSGENKEIKLGSLITYWR